MNIIKSEYDCEYDYDRFLYSKIYEMILYTCPVFRSCIARDAYVSELDQYCRKINIKNIFIIKLASNDEFVDWLSKEINYKNSWSMHDSISLMELRE